MENLEALIANYLRDYKGIKKLDSDTLMSSPQ